MSSGFPLPPVPRLPELPVPLPPGVLPPEVELLLPGRGLPLIPPDDDPDEPGVPLMPPFVLELPMPSSF